MLHYLTNAISLSVYIFLGLVTLERQLNGETITISFDCQDEAEMDMEDMPEEQETNENEEDGASLEYGINMDVTITKASGEKVVVTAVASRKLIVRNVRHLALGKEISDTKSYGGPLFEELNEELQDSFYSYLEDRGVDDELCFFVLSNSRVKEQAEYSNWLKKMLTFVEK